jgi:hypothetical protein
VHPPGLPREAAVQRGKQCYEMDNCESSVKSFRKLSHPCRTPSVPERTDGLANNIIEQLIERKSAVRRITKILHPMIPPREIQLGLRIVIPARGAFRAAGDRARLNRRALGIAHPLDVLQYSCPRQGSRIPFQRGGPNLSHIFHFASLVQSFLASGLIVEPWVAQVDCEY